MSKRFVARRSLQVFLLAFTILALDYFARGQALVSALTDAARWSALSTLFFVFALVYHHKTKKPCAVCVEAPPVRKT